MTELRFITNDQLRRLIERDRKELTGCITGELHKAALVLAGSIIEAILVDYFLAFPPSDKSPAAIVDATLASLIDWAQQDKLISSRTKEISTVIRNYRNLIHPGRELRLQERVDGNTAQVAASLVEIVIDEIAENYSQKLGYSAEQAIQKVRLDPGASAILSHIVKTMQTAERAKLFRMIPTACAEDSDEVVDTFIVLHTLLKPTLPDPLHRAEAAKVYEHIRGSAQKDALFYMRFFRNDPHLLDEVQRGAVTDYLLDVLTHGRNDIALYRFNYWGVFEWLSKTLDSSEGRKCLIEDIVNRPGGMGDSPVSENDQAYLQIIAGICESWGWETQEAFLSELRQWGVSSKWIEFIDDKRLPF